MGISGTIPPMLTPTTEAMDVDTGALRELTNRLADGGVHGLFPTGTTGEFSSLSREQRRTVVRTVVDESGDLPVLAGCGGTAIPAVQQYIEDAAAAGADVAVVVTPYYVETDQAGIVEFYERIARKSRLPVYVYHIPQYTGNRIDPATVQQLATVPNIVGIKDSSGDFPYFMQLIDATPSEFAVLQGIPTYSLLSLEHGADGLVAGPANVFPRPMSELYEASVAGDYVRARERLSKVVLPILSTTRSVPMVAALKHLSGNAGYDLGDPLPPRTGLTDDQRDDLDACFQAITETGLVAADD